MDRLLATLIEPLADKMTLTVRYCPNTQEIEPYYHIVAYCTLGEAY